MDIFRFLCLGLVQAIFLFGSSMAEDDVVPDSATHVRFDFAQRCKVGDHTFILDDKTTLAGVIKTLGSGVIHRIGTPGDADPGWVVDYTDGRRLVRFASDGDMGGDDHVLEGVDVRPLTASEKIAGLPSLRPPVTFQFGSVGMSFSDLETVLGPAVRKRGVAWYVHTGKRPIKVSSGEVLEYDVLATLRVNVVEGKVVAIQLWHVTSY